MAYCCPEQEEWYMHAESLSQQLTDMVDCTTRCTGRKNVYHYEFDLGEPYLDLNKLRGFCRDILANKLLHTREWPHEKLCALEKATTTKIEVPLKYKNL